LIRVQGLALAIGLVILPLTFILVTGFIEILPVSVRDIVFEISFIVASILFDIAASSLAPSVRKLSL
jgi:hypothetical protein